MPNWNHIVREHLAVLSLPPEREIEIVEELALHFEAVYEDALADGLSEAEAEARALRSYDWRLLECELIRVERPWRPPTVAVELIERKGGIRMESLLQDLRFGLRMLMKQPGLTLIATLTLALGIGANTAIFTLLDKVLIRPLPVEQPDQLVIFVRDASGDPGIFSYPLYTDLRDRNEVLSGMVAYFQRPFSLSDGSQSERVTGQIVSGNYFAALGVRPALGRFFLPEEDRTPGAHPVIVISHGLWRRRFGADPAMIGKTVGLNNYRYTVVGVAPSEFTGTTRGTMNDVYVPMMMQAQTGPGRDAALDNRNWGWLQLIGRLKPNVSRQQAQAALSLLTEEPGQTSPGAKDSGKFANRIFLLDGSRGHTERVSDLALLLKLLMGVVGFVLLIACANVD